MKIHAVTFASDDMSRSAQLCIDSAYAQGIDTHARFTPGNIASWDMTVDTVKQNAALFSQPRGCGYWAFKSLILEATMRNAEDGSICIYADAGVEFIEPVQRVIDRTDQDIFLFGNEHEHAHWCKRDIVEAVWPLPIDRQSFVDAGIQMNTPSNIVAVDVDGIESLYSWARFGKQAQASVIFFRVNDYTRAFVKEWLDWCLFENGRLIDDSPSRTPNHPEFKENRHDQAILTTMAYREGIKLHHWFVKYLEWTPGRSPYYPDEFERPLFHHHRWRNDQWPTSYREQAA